MPNSHILFALHCQAKIFGDDHDGTSSQAIISFHGNKHGNCLQCSFFIRSFLLGTQGVPPHQRHPQIPWITGTITPNLDPFSHLFF